MAEPPVRDRVLHLATRVREIKGMVGLRPGFQGPAQGWRRDEAVQRVLDAFLRGSGPLDAELRAIAADGLDTGRMAAAVELEDGRPARLRRRDPRRTPWPSPEAPWESTVGVSDDAWDDAEPPPPPLPDDAPELEVARVAWQLQAPLARLLNGLLGEVIRWVGIHGSADVEFADPLAPDGTGDGAERAPETGGPVPRPKGGRPPDRLQGFPPGSAPRLYALIREGRAAGLTHQEIQGRIVATFQLDKWPAESTYLGWVKRAQA